jgi:hypothetical protein
MDMDTMIVPPMITCNRVTHLLRNQLLSVVPCDDFATLKKAVTGNCNGAVTVKKR